MSCIICLENDPHLIKPCKCTFIHRQCFVDWCFSGRKDVFTCSICDYEYDYITSFITTIYYYIYTYCCNVVYQTIFIIFMELV